MRIVGRGLCGVLILGVLLVPVSAPADGGQDNHTHRHPEVQSSDGPTPTDGDSETSKRSPSGLPRSDTMAGDTSGEAPGLLSRVLPGFSQAPNLHPMFVHFPIVFFYAALFFAALSWYRRRSFFLALSRWMFWLGLGTLPLAAATGFWAVGGWGHEHVTVHRNLMLATTVLAVVLLGLTRWCSDRQRLYRIVLTAGLVVVTGVMTLGADRGAWLVFVQGSGVRSEGHVHQDDSGDRAAPGRSFSGTAPGDDRERPSDGDGQSLSDGTGSEHHDHDHPHP